MGSIITKRRPDFDSRSCCGCAKLGDLTGRHHRVRPGPPRPADALAGLVVLVSWLILGQVPWWLTMAGGTLCLAGVAIVRVPVRLEGRAPLRRSRWPPKASPIDDRGVTAWLHGVDAAFVDAAFVDAAFVDAAFVDAAFVLSGRTAALAHGGRPASLAGTDAVLAGLRDR